MSLLDMTLGIRADSLLTGATVAFSNSVFSQILFCKSLLPLWCVYFILFI